jgi:hypothetical protein
MKRIIFAGVGSLFVMLYAEIRRETAREEATLRATLAKNCPLVWEHMDQIRAQGSEAIKWCPDA